MNFLYTTYTLDALTFYLILVFTFAAGLFAARFRVRVGEFMEWRRARSVETPIDEPTVAATTRKPRANSKVKAPLTPAQKRSKAAKKVWASLTPEQRMKRLEALHRGRQTQKAERNGDPAVPATRSPANDDTTEPAAG